MSKVSVRRAARSAQSEDRKARTPARKQKAADSFQNFSLSIGIGTNNALSGSTYGFNPITRIRTLLEWIHRGSWLGGVAIDLVADDMTREGIEITSKIAPEDEQNLDNAIVQQDIWGAFNRAIKWARLYGGAIAVPLIDGQDPSTPLRPDRIGKNGFKGIAVFDRWMVDPSLNDLVTEYGPYLGLPKFYTVRTDGPALRGQRIHYTRAYRFIGVELPYWQSLTENLWGISEIERLYDRMIAFDSSTMGAAQLVYKSHLRTYKAKDLRKVVAAGGAALQALQAAVTLMAQYQSTEGISLIDAEDELTAIGFTNFSGISDALAQFGQQLSGALQIPLVRLFGQSPAGLNSTGESDLRTYYDGIKKRQNASLRIPAQQVYQMAALSEGINLGDGFTFQFKSLWQLTEKEKTEVAEGNARAVDTMFEAGVIGRMIALKELKQSSRQTGVFSSISDNDIAEADEQPPDIGEESGVPEAEDENAPARDNAIYPGGLPVMIESLKGSVRRGGTMQADYGYIVGTLGEDGDEMDCFIGPDRESDRVWIVYQKRLRDGLFDEHKAMIGFNSESEAIAAYTGSYSHAGAERIMKVDAMSMASFRDWLKRPQLSIAA